MGKVYCASHNRRACWGCDSCPTCQPSTGRLLRGDYCRACTERAKAAGLKWSPYHQNWVKPELARPLLTHAERLKGA